MGEENIAGHIEYEMKLRGWSQERLAHRMRLIGYPVHQSAISKILNPQNGQRRKISVDEAIAFARVFDIPLDKLLLEPPPRGQGAEVRRILGRIEDLVAKRRAVDQEIGALRCELDRLTANDES